VTAEYSNCAPDPKAAGKLFSKVFCTLLVMTWVCGARQIGAQAASTTSGLQLVTTPASSPLRSFLNRGVWPGYYNFGKTSFQPQTNSVRSTELYDRLGTHLFRGYPLLSWRETRSDSVGLQSSTVTRENYFFNFFNNLMIANDTYRGWDLSVTAGDAIRTSLSPLTVRSPRWQGLRIDGGTGGGDQGFTALLTRGAPQRFSAFDARRDLSPVLAYGGHYFHKLNDMLTLGLTFFNQHQTDVESGQGSFVSGSQPYQMRSPKQVSIWVESDDPNTVAGVRDIDVDLVIIDDDGTRRRLTSDADAGGDRTYDPSLEPGPALGAGSPVNGLYQVTGSQVAEFLFNLPADAHIVSARFHADVTGDYRISVRQVHDFVNADGDLEERFWPSAFVNRPGHTQRGNKQYPYDFKPQQDEPHYTVARAEGRPGLGGVHSVSFDYGIPSGKTLLGTDFRLLSKEWIAEGEIVYSSDESHFPFSSDSLGIRGKRLKEGSWAYLLNVRRPMTLGAFHIDLGAELFRMDPQYSGGYDSRRGGTVLFTDKGSGSGDEAFTQEFPLMEDNDDNDAYADDSFNDQGRFQFYVPSGNYSGGSTGGVFPGLDEDGDLSPDNDKDRNGVPDWSEPFLLFDSDPADFVYGMDFNNNGQPDFRENDDHPDYPIRKDQRGRHGFVTFHDLLPGIRRTSLGYYSLEEIAGPGEASSLYARTEAGWRPYPGLEIEFFDDVKLVEDDVRDDVYEWVTGDTSRLANVYTILNPPPADPLIMRESLVNTASLGLTYAPTPQLRFSSEVLHFHNRQSEIEQDGVLVQDSDSFTEWSWISRGEYRRYWGNFEFWGGVKYALKEGRRGNIWAEASTRLFAPMFKTSYQIMDGIDLQWGMSGFPGLPMKYTDNENDNISYEERKTVIMLHGRDDDYEGSYVSISTGIEFHNKDWKGLGKERDFDAFGLFVEVIVGN
jgi:hypothetical protein